MTDQSSTQLLDEQIKELVLARLKAGAPEGIAISFGGSTGEPINKSKLIEHVKKGDAIGQKYIQIQMKFLTSLKEGSLYE